MSVSGVSVASAEGRSAWRLTGRTPNITAAVGDTLWLRIINAAPTRSLVIHSEPGSAVALRIALIAIDGITLSAPVTDPVELEGVPLTGNHSGVSGGLLLPSGGRYDLLATVEAVTTSALDIPRAASLWHVVATCTAPLASACPDSNPFPLLEVDLAKAVAGRAPRTKPASLMPVRLRPPARLRYIPASEVTAHRRLVISQDRMRAAPPGQPPELVNRERDPVSMAGMGYYINNRTYDPRRVDLPGVMLGSAEEWVIDNPGSSGQGHPWHVHTHPFLVVGLFALSGDDGSVVVNSTNLVSQPFWTDTAWVPLGARLVTRMRALTPWVGRSVFHCHMLTHEDLGMMGVYEIRDVEASYNSGNISLPSPSSSTASTGTTDR